MLKRTKWGYSFLSRTFLEGISQQNKGKTRKRDNKHLKMFKDLKIAKEINRKKKNKKDETHMEEINDV